MDNSTVILTASTTLSVTSLVATTVLAFAAYRTSVRQSRMQADRTSRDAWNMLNQVALSDDANLLVADTLMAHEAIPGQSADEIRRRWLGYMLLNALASTYMDVRRGHTASPEYQLRVVRDTLTALLQADDIYLMTQSGYEDEFMSLCRQIHQDTASVAVPAP